VPDSRRWIAEVVEETGLDQESATQAVRAVLQALRDALGVEQNERLAPEMSPVFRELYFQNWSASRPPPTVADAAAFLERVRERFPNYARAADFGRTVRAALGVLERHMPGPAQRIRHLLPKSIRALWPSTIAEEVLERHEELMAQERDVQRQALHAEDGHERGAPMAPHQNRTPGEEHRGGPLPNRM
jgi:uncharacterized protein (DUF2267 family)